MAVGVSDPLGGRRTMWLERGGQRCDFRSGADLGLIALGASEWEEQLAPQPGVLFTTK